MIHVNRKEEPEVFRSEKMQEAKIKLWEQQKNKKAQERLIPDSSPYNPAYVRSELSKTFNNKCAYCESSLGEAGKLYIDHFRPRTGSKDFDNKFFPDHYAWLSYDWANLYLSCEVCNSSKGNWFPVEANRAPVFGNVTNEVNLIIDPCLENPEEHFQYADDGTILSKTRKGKVTIDILKLNRYSLVDARMVYRISLQSKLSLLEKRKNITPELIEQIENIHAENPAGPYIGIQRYFFKEWLKKNSNIWEKIRNLNTPNIDKFESRGYINIEQESSKKAIAKTEKQLTQLKRIDIEKIEIHNFKSIVDLKLAFEPNTDSNIQPWLLLLGDNGVGKSSILQAIALTLMGQDLLDKSEFNCKEILRHGTKKGHVKIFERENKEPITLSFTSTSITAGSKEPITYLMGFGSSRLLPKGDFFKPENAISPYVKVRNLFDYTTSLIDANQWLLNLRKDEFDRSALALKDFLMLKNEDSLIRKRKKIYVNQYGDSSTLDELSDGYKSIIALAIDIMNTLSVNQAYYDTIEGVVLIDEIGNHLHPRWKMQIVECLKRAFKSMQFIVTTHDPLCLRGLRHGEVIVLLRDSDNKVLSLDKKVLPDHNYLEVEQLLTSDFFGLINTLDATVEQQYQEYYELLSLTEPDEIQKERIEELRKIINEKEQLGRTEREDAVLKVYDEITARSAAENSFKPKTQLKEEVLKEVKESILKTFDWL